MRHQWRDNKQMHFSIPVTYNKPFKKLLLNSPCLQNEAAKKISCFLMAENTLLDSVAKQFTSQSRKRTCFQKVVV